MRMYLFGTIVAAMVFLAPACGGNDDSGGCKSPCLGRECGPDPDCGTWCGDCAVGQTCTSAGKCVTTGPNCPADQDCTGRECGLDPVCRLSCGMCPSGETCVDGRCVCNPIACAGCCDAAGKCVDGTSDYACGSGGSTCKVCGFGKTCESGSCVTGGYCSTNADCSEDAVCQLGWCQAAWGLSYQVTARDGRYYTLPSDPDGSYPDPYVEFTVDGIVCKTSTLSNTSAPVWNQGCEFTLHSGSTFGFNVYDADDFAFDDVIQTLTVRQISLQWLHDGTVTFTAGDGSWTRFVFQALCLPPGTMIRLADGTQKAIEAVLPGESVVGYNASTGEAVIAVVERVLVHDAGPFTTSLITLEDARTFEATPNHPILTLNGEWRRVAEIAPGDAVYVFDPDSASLRPVLVASIIREYSEHGTVYNLKTTASSYVAEDIVVHNKCLRAGSLVDTPTGPRPVEAIRVGDIVFGNVQGVPTPTTVRRVFVKTTILPSLPGRQLTRSVAVTDNHPVWDGTAWRRASETTAPAVRVFGAVYDLATDAGNYYADGVLLQAAE